MPVPFLLYKIQSQIVVKRAMIKAKLKTLKKIINKC